MKILFISQYFYPENFKGNDIVFDFVKKGYEVTVLTGKPNYPQGKFYKGYSFFNKRKEFIKGAKIVRVPVFPRKSGSGIPLALNYFSFVIFSFFAVFFRLKEKYDLVFVQQLSPVTMALPGLWIKRKQKIPMYLWVLDLWPESVVANSQIKKGFIINFLEKLVRKIYNNSDVILMSSKFFKNSILEKCQDFNKKIIYFPNWAEDVFVRGVENEVSSVKLPDFPEGFNIMFAGNIGESQGFEAVLNAAELTMNRKINWILIGDGRKANWIKEEVLKRNIKNVFMYGRFDLELMPRFFKRADAMLVSLKDEEIFSLTVPAKVQAYMASKKIILGMLNGEGKDLINDSGCGFCVAAGDANLLAEKSVLLSEMSKIDIEIMEEKSLAYYKENFSKERLFENLDSLFRERIELN